MDAVDDIEDLITSENLISKNYHPIKKRVTVRSRRKLRDIDEAYKSSVACKNILEYVIPEKQKIFLKTWGCAHNNSDSEYMAGQLASYGYGITSNKEEADLWVLNSCTVKNPSEDTFRNEINAAQVNGKHVVLAGCVPQAAPKSNYMQDFSIVGVHQIDRVAEVVEETLKGHTIRFLQPKKINGKKVAGPSLAFPKIRKNPLIEIIPINSGCLNACTYCKTKFARADLVSYPVEDIVERARHVLSEEGVCEIWLTSEDTGTYGRDIGSSLPKLLWKLIDVIPNGCMLRLGMTNPPYILEHLDEMAKILSHPKVYSFLHLPVQSGSDMVLADMKREYTRSDFERIVDFLRHAVPGITIATDIICGFPTETEADFQDTIKLCKKYEFPSLFINQFYPRPGTPAAKLKRIAANLVKTRTKRLTNLFYSYKPLATKYTVGTRQRILVTEISHDKKHFVGHNKFYEQFLLPMTEGLLGKLVEVEITAITKFSVLAEVVLDRKDWIDCSKLTITNQSWTPLGNQNATMLSKISESYSSNLYLFALALCGVALVYRCFIISFNYK